jgi:hypothetical protein
MTRFLANSALNAERATNWLGVTSWRRSTWRSIAFAITMLNILNLFDDPRFAHIHAQASYKGVGGCLLKHISGIIKISISA